MRQPTLFSNTLGVINDDDILIVNKHVKNLFLNFQPVKLADSLSLPLGNWLGIPSLPIAVSFTFLVQCILFTVKVHAFHILLCKFSEHISSDYVLLATP